MQVARLSLVHHVCDSAYAGCCIDDVGWKLMRHLIQLESQVFTVDITTSRARETCRFTSNKVIYFASSIPPNLWTSGFVVDFRIGRVLKLLQAESIGSLFHQLLAPADCSCHPLYKNQQQELQVV